MTTDPRDVISNARMGRLQVTVVAITVLLNAMDGFDVLAISLALPGIAADWGVSTAVLGYVVSAEIFGMAIASMVLGGVADRIGRRPTILGCLIVMAVGMFMATTAQGVVTLSIWRVVTGLGIGGILATAGAVAAEFSSARRRHLSVSLMSIGYPIGGALGSYVVRNLLVTYDWRAIFYLGAAHPPAPTSAPRSPSAPFNPIRAIVGRCTFGKDGPRSVWR
jgi:MFS family permease